MASHKEFEGLIITSALGEIRGDDQEALTAHLRDCEDCRKAATEYHSLIRHDLPLVHEANAGTAPKVSRASESKRRAIFLQAAENKGFHFSTALIRRREQSFWGLPELVSIRGLTVVAVVLVVLASAAVFISYQRKSVGTAEVADLQQRLQRANAEAAGFKAQAQQSGSAEHEAIIEAARLREQIAALQQQVADLQVQLQVGNRDVTVLRTALEQKDASLADARKKLTDLEASVTQVKAENKSLADSHGTDEALALSQEKRLDELTHELQAKDVIIGETKTMMSADRDIRDLMGARQLHIVDVFDADTNGKRQKRFGRVFYTEGKSLVFYAFDLTKPGIVEAKESFQAWGTKYGTQNEAVKLGMFYMDDKSQRRWALKVDDAAVLSEIDSVFVTAEPSRDGKKPTGHRLLFAFLKNPANHP